MTALDTSSTQTKKVPPPDHAGDVTTPTGATTDNTHQTSVASDASSHSNFMSDLWNTASSDVKSALQAMQHPVATVEAAYHAVHDSASNVLSDLVSGYDADTASKPGTQLKNAETADTRLNQVFGGDLSNIFSDVNAQGQRTVTDQSSDKSKTYTDGPGGKQTFKDTKTGADVTYDKNTKTAEVRDIAGTGITEQDTPNGNWKTLPDGRQVFTSTGDSTDFDKRQIKDGKLYVFKDGVVMTRNEGDIYAYHKNGEAEIFTPQGKIHVKDGQITFNGQSVNDQNLADIQKALQSEQLIKRDPSSGRIILDRHAPRGMQIDNGQPDRVHVHIDNATAKGEGADIVAKPQETTNGRSAPATVTFDIPNEFRTVSTFPPAGSSGQPQEQAFDLRPQDQVNGQPPQLFDYNYSNGDMAVGGDPNGLNPAITFTPSDTEIGWDGTTVDPDDGTFTSSDGSIIDPTQVAATNSDVAEISDTTVQANTIASNAVAGLNQIDDPGQGAAAIAQLDAAKAQIADQTNAPSYLIDAAVSKLDATEATVVAAMQRDQERLNTKNTLSVVAFNPPTLNGPARFDDGGVSLSTTAA